MPLYFFHLRDGEDVVLDLEGTELADMNAVRVLALQHARTLISEGVKEGGVPLHLSLEVRDGDGRLCWTLPFKDAVELIQTENPVVDFGMIPTRPLRLRRS